MPKSAKDLQPGSLPIAISNSLLVHRLTQSIAVLFTSTVLVPLAAAEPVQEVVQPKSVVPTTNVIPQPEAARLPPLTPFNYKEYLEPTISYDEVRSMTQELEGLIGRFKSTLLTANANYDSTDISTGEIIRQILKREISRKENNKDLLRNKSSFKDANYALQQAQQRFQIFRELVEQGRYVNAKAEWLAIRKILWDNYPQDRPLAESEVRGMWLDRGTIVKAKSEADLAKVFDRMAIAGINTVFLETVNSSYTIYPSRVAPQQNPLIDNWDPLKAATKLAHERGMEIHAWVWTFAAVNQRHNEILNLPRNYLGPVLSKRPDWAMTDREGSNFHYSSGKVFFDPANPEVRQYLLSLISEIATNYEVDGIHLDYIRYPFQSPTGEMTYGYSIAAREQFRMQTGFDPIRFDTSHPLWSEWTEFRIAQIDNFVAEVSRNLKQLRPELTLSTAVFPMDKDERLLKIQQSWEKWVARGWIDLLIPMTYARDTARLYTLTRPLLREFEAGTALLLPGIRLLNISEVAALDQMQLLRGMSTEGYALFAAENLNPRLASMFNNIQGEASHDSKQYLPHREPFQVVLSRYQSLQQEWNYFLTNYAPEIEDGSLKEWAKRSDRLDSTLKELIEEPSAKNLFSTQIALNSLRRQFPLWMAKTKGVDAYQAQVWKNRLDTLDRILNYGEKKILNVSL